MNAYLQSLVDYIQKEKSLSVRKEITPAWTASGGTMESATTWTVLQQRMVSVNSGNSWMP